MKRYLLATLCTAFFSISTAQTARVQIIHNSPDAATEQVDLYIDGVLWVDNFLFRTSSPFLNIPLGNDMQVAIAMANSTSVADAFYELPVELISLETYVLILSGIVDTASYTAAPAFAIEVFEGGRDNAIDPANVDVVIHQGSPDAPVLDIIEISNTGSRIIVDDANHGEYFGYLEAPTQNYTVQLTDETGTEILNEYNVPFETLNLGSESITALLSGFMDTTANNNGPGFGIWLALPEGGALLELESTSLGTTQNTLATTSLYPNPATSVIHIDGLENNNYTFTIVDMLGRTLQTLQGNDANATINVENLLQGSYQLVITDNGTILGTKSFIKQ